ncbi:hypothetical protein PGT21_032616 [Puccinia graminis f. sp. tritici]|uniref:Uncharacterized protein n=1 Tax=Puccinia graminis f. sp. tritici TaxID=56615 RepID=A0A5B0P892_PUCGR|nr:hypothetical protein PGT21_032616 [Puccinia graminis f. sp. tritici]KAA1107893.1 hypothetical protein PGTUg99_002205 [Puccinia graminis f. sp. tritici]
MNQAQFKVPWSPECWGIDLEVDQFDPEVWVYFVHHPSPHTHPGSDPVELYTSLRHEPATFSGDLN